MLGINRRLGDVRHPRPVPRLSGQRSATPAQSLGHGMVVNPEQPSDPGDRDASLAKLKSLRRHGLIDRRHDRIAKLNSQRQGGRGSRPLRSRPPFNRSHTWVRTTVRIQVFQQLQRVEVRAGHVVRPPGSRHDRRERDPRPGRRLAAEERQPEQASVADGAVARGRRDRRRGQVARAELHVVTRTAHGRQGASRRGPQWIGCRLSGCSALDLA